MKRFFLLSFVVLFGVLVDTQGTIMPNPKFTAFDGNGLIVASAKLCTYAAGTTTPQATYTDSALSVANTNPVIMDSAGRATVFLSATSYKFTLLTAGTDLTCSTGSTLWSQDNIGAVPTTSGNVDMLCTAGENIVAGQAVYWSDGSGSKSPGQCYKADTANAYSSTTNPVGIAPAAITSGLPGTIRLQGRLTGMTTVTGSRYYVGSAGAITTTASSTNPHLLGIADSTTSLVLAGTPQINPPLAVVLGGTSVASLTANNVLLGNGTSGVLSVAPSTSGNVLTSNGTTWASTAISNTIKISSFTHDSSTTGAQSVTGVGFQPRSLIFFTSLGSSAVATTGFDNGTTAEYTVTALSTVAASTSNSIAAIVDSSNLNQAKITSLIADGFTVTWSKTGTPTGTSTTLFMAFQ